ncbi:MAG: alpha/beta fold hydrolase [Geitlerinemataceae cyanobacterium]
MNLEADPQKEKLSDRVYTFLSHRYSLLKWIHPLLSYKRHHLKLQQLRQFQKIERVNDRPSKPIIFTADTLNIIGDLYCGNERSPVILLLHGSSIFGRKLPLIRALAKEFQALGYTVLTFDLRGHGESDKPQDYTGKSFDFARDVEAAIDELERRLEIKNRRLYVVGHSFGGGVALAAQARDKRIEKVVVFGPPRRLSERFLNPEAREKVKLLFRWQLDMQLNKPLTFSMWKPAIERLNIENYVEQFSQPGHIPLFVIDAEREPAEDLAFLRAFSQKATSPKNYWTVPNTDHYLDSGFVRIIPYYDRQLVMTFVDRIDRWFQEVD